MPQVLSQAQIRFRQIKRQDKVQAIHEKRQAPILAEMAKIREANPTISDSLCRTLAFRRIRDAKLNAPRQGLAEEMARLRQLNPQIEEGICRTLALSKLNKR